MSPPTPALPLRVRWLGRVTSADAAALQHRLFDEDAADHLLLEHHHAGEAAASATAHADLAAGA